MRPRRQRHLLAVLAAVAVFAVLVRLQPGGPQVARTLDDIGQLLAAVLASAACGRQARRSPRRGGRPAWLLLALGTGCWALGEAVWSYYELLAGRQTPFPSPADAGFLLFPVLAAAGLLLWPSAALVGGARWRALLDAVMVAGALFILSWVTALGTAVRGGSDSTFGYVVSVGYPVSDLVLLTLTIVIVAHAGRVGGSGLALLALGLASLCVADSGFAYLTATERYATGSPVDAGWFGGFLLIAAAAGTATSGTATSGTATAGGTATDPDAGPGAGPAPVLGSATGALLPYVPAGLGLAVAVGGELAGRGDRLSLLAATLVMVALLVRQLLAVLDNRRLLAELLDAQRELRHQAFHDPLTGLANRALFGDRLRHGLDLHRRDLRPISLLYCDLDGFKTVNDTLGHDAGDAVLRAVAERLRAVIRPGDTVARLGGDEFAVLLEDGGDAGAVAARILDALTTPAAVGRHTVPVGCSIGMVALAPGQPPVDPELFLRRADAAMYHAKRTGKGAAWEWTAELDAPTLPQQAGGQRRTGHQPEQTSR